MQKTEMGLYQSPDSYSGTSHYDAIDFEVPMTLRENMRVIKYKYDIDKIRCILGKLLLKYILKKHYRIQNSDITFKYKKYGNEKPMLENFLIYNLIFRILDIKGMLQKHEKTKKDMH